ncbi:MAG TPA: Holliday junction branch migration protein RuvA [Bacillota bacterium]|nr:Holliday junction branch migration protein RuvA [Bacillota bacterium]
MIEYLRGPLVSVEEGAAILEIGGVGVRILIPDTVSLLPAPESREVTLYTRLVIREEEILLYGFSDPRQRELFNLITGVSGFGPRLALSLLNLFSVEQLCSAIAAEDAALLSQAPGVGRKSAQRLILELKEKVKSFPAAVAPAQEAGEAGLRVDIIEALCALGYSRLEAADALRRVEMERGAPENREEGLKLALQKLASRS